MSQARSGRTPLGNTITLLAPCLHGSDPHPCLNRLSGQRGEVDRPHCKRKAQHLMHSRRAGGRNKNDSSSQDPSSSSSS